MQTSAHGSPATVQAPAPHYYPPRPWQPDGITGASASRCNMREEFKDEFLFHGVHGLDAPARIPRGGIVTLKLASDAVWAEWTVDRPGEYW